MMKNLWRVVREYAGFLSVGFLAIATYLAFQIALRPPPAEHVTCWLLGFVLICGLALLASFIQQRVANAQGKALEAENERHSTLLKQIATAVGATQAESAENAADSKQQILQLELKISQDTKPVVIIRFSVDGDKNPTALPTVENVGKTAATNVKIEDIQVNGAHGPGTFEEVDVLAPGEKKEVQFDAPDEGLAFRGYFIAYLENDLQHRPPIDWDAIKTQDDAHDLFAPLKMPLCVVYTDPATGRRYRSEHELEFTFGKHSTVIFRRQVEIT
jgi:hypothetical protein